MDIRLSAIHLYPVKGVRAIDVDRAEVDKIGLRGDRRWVIVDDQGKFLSQRSHPQLARITAGYSPTGLDLSAPDQPTLNLEIPNTRDLVKVTVWSDSIESVEADPGANEWISRYLDQPCRLIYMDDTGRRPISSPKGNPGDSVSFADGYPCLVISTASLEDLNSRTPAPIPMDRFRPNLVIEGCDPFAEDYWPKFSLGDVVFRNAGQCARCSVTTLDQKSGHRISDEPLKTLAGFRRTGKGVLFGVNLIPEGTGTISIGDKLTILD